MVRSLRPSNARARGAAFVALAVALTATIALPQAQPVAAQSVDQVMQDVNAAVAAAGNDPNALMAALPAAVTSGHGADYQAVMSGDAGAIEAAAAQTAPTRSPISTASPAPTSPRPSTR